MALKPVRFAPPPSRVVGRKGSEGSGRKAGQALGILGGVAGGIIGGVTGAAAGGVGAIPGAMAGFSAGSGAGQLLGSAAGERFDPAREDTRQVVQDKALAPTPLGDGGSDRTRLLHEAMDALGRQSQEMQQQLSDPLGRGLIASIAVDKGGSA